MKLFKKQSIIDTATNVGIGGAANVAIDYAVAQIDALAKADPMYINLGKIAVGVLGGTMIKSKVARAAVDGIAVVGVSNLVKDLISDEATTETTQPTTGLAKGTIGRTIPGNRRYVRTRVSGIGAAANSFMGK